MTSYIYDMVDTWNAGATTFTAVKMNVTDTASAAGSLLMDLQVGGVSRVRFDKTGSLRFTSDGTSLGINGTNGTIDLISAAVGSSTVLLRITNGVPSLRSDASIGFAATTTVGVNDTILSRRGPANLRLGAADAAAPVAQTLSVQSVVAGTSNTAGANLTITGSQGTGTGAGGSIVFQVAPAGSSGTAQNALATALTIDSTSTVTLPGKLIAGGTGLTAYSIQGTSIVASTQLGFVSGGVNRIYANAVQLSLIDTAVLGWANGDAATALDVILRRDAANTLALRNGANAQESRIYGSYTDATNYQRMSIKTLRESSGALSGASYTTTIAIPAYAVPVGVTTRVTTAITGATSYDVGDGTDVDLWGDNIGITLGSQSRTADFTAIAAVDAAATARTVTLTAVGSNFTGGVVEICVHYLTTEAD